jgi:hypothetical protein
LKIRVTSGVPNRARRFSWQLRFIGQLCSGRHFCLYLIDNPLLETFLWSRSCERMQPSALLPLASVASDGHKLQKIA